MYGGSLHEIENGISIEDVLNLIFSVPEKYRRNGTLLMNDTTLRELYKLQSRGNESKAEWAAYSLNRDMDRALLRNEKKGLLAQVEALAVTEVTEEAIIALWQSVPRQYQENAVFYMN